MAKQLQAPILEIPCPLPIRITSWEQWKGSLHGVIGEMSLELCLQFAAYPFSQFRWCCAVSYPAVCWGHGPEPASSAEAAWIVVGVLGTVQSCHSLCFGDRSEVEIASSQVHPCLDKRGSVTAVTSLSGCSTQCCCCSWWGTCTVCLECLCVSGSQQADRGPSCHTGIPSLRQQGVQQDRYSQNNLVWQSCKSISVNSRCLAPLWAAGTGDRYPWPTSTSLKWIGSTILIPFCPEKEEFHCACCFQRHPVFLGLCLSQDRHSGCCHRVSQSDFCEVPETLDCLFPSEILGIHLFSVCVCNYHLLVGFWGSQDIQDMCVRVYVFMCFPFYHLGGCAGTYFCDSSL